MSRAPGAIRPNHNHPWPWWWAVLFGFGSLRVGGSPPLPQPLNPIEGGATDRSNSGGVAEPRRLKASAIRIVITRCHCTLGGSVQMCVKDILNIFSRARAMWALQGKFVCGERITVNWSKQQPRFSKDFRTSRTIESSHRRAPRDGNFRFRDSVAQKNHPASHDQGHSPDVAPEKKSSDGALENKSDDDVEDLKDVTETVGEDPVEMKRNEDGTSDANARKKDEKIWVSLEKVARYS
ncbi:hypothetical protein E2562_023616 [Oryza meyeriana var. granulata]|uniref:Uncharacterized protein n=1 Tax=Oryza meyeriana var. granulata TaxID=110450 RepID=A0A6G1FBQ1_9ORYZ|nr:hypothetical protein E2562_023616 [Oryza meyeriana var. granulata]